MAGYNRIIIVGNLTRDPELRQLPSGQSVCRLNIATNRQFKSRQSGEMVQEVCFIDVDVWGPQAESSSKFLQKGRSVLVEGRLKLDSWQDQEGKARSKHSIVADRVVFLSAGGAAAEQSDDVEAEQALEPRNEVERELMSQLDAIKNKQKGAAQTAPKPSRSQASKSNQDLGGASFQDTPPFESDLPF